MANSRIALVAGATGLTGGHLLTSLKADKRYAKVVALVRQAGLQESKKLAECVVDFNALPPLPHANDAYCCLGTTIKKAGSKAAFRQVDFDYVVNVARAAKKAGVKRFMVVSSLGADARSTVFYSRIKGEMELALREIGFDALHIFQPSFILGARNEKRPAELFGIAAFNMVGALLLGPLRKYRAIESVTIARAMINAALSHERGVCTYSSDKIERMV